MEYEVNDDTLIIYKSPKVLTRKMLENLDIDLKYMSNICLCDDIEEIENKTFSKLPKLKLVRFSNNLKRIGEEAFCWCEGLKKICFPSSLEVVEKSAFICCVNLEYVSFNEGLKVVNEQAFSYCRNLKSVSLPDSLCFLGEGAFYMCSGLENAKVSNNINILEKEVFCSCENLKSIELPKILEKINASCFESCFKLSALNLSKYLKYIGKNAFYNCENLKELILPSRLQYLGEGAFVNCKQLAYVSIGENIKEIQDKTFSRSGIEYIDLPFNLKSIGKEAFSFCSKLKSITIPDEVKEIGENAFFCSYNLKEIYLPKKLEKISVRALDTSLYDGCDATLFIDDAGEKLKIDCKRKKIINNDKKILFLYDSESNIYSFYYNGKYTKFNKEVIDDNKCISKLMEHKLIKEKDLVRVYYWLNKKFIPSPSVMKNMPIKDVDNFFINNNCLEWNKLIKESNINLDENKESFFKLCYVLGVFNISSSIRDKAVRFIKENILVNMNGEDIHSKFGGFDLENGYNNEYADFFMKYYNPIDFLHFHNGHTIFDLTAASYNNFSNVKKTYPNKIINTNRDADLLLPEHVIRAIRAVEYDNIDKGNEKFALLVGSYGYTQSQFEKLQKWYNEGKIILDEDMKLFISEDNKQKGITYKLLKKSDPVCAVLGNITNCCQIVSADGESCVEYGMKEPNSGFITFNYEGKIIGQAWVWYDEESKTICLDNIEMPHNCFEKIQHNTLIKDNFIECIFRIENNFKSEMKKRGFKVDKVTIGKGHNELSEILEKNFSLIRKIEPLKGYSGYSDAYYQYEISN